MITCPVCATPNSDLATTCISCKGYLQTRIDTLDLFSTIWGLIESPRRTMKRVVLSQHKNYVIILSGLAGIALTYGLVWLRKTGNTDDSAMVLFVPIIVGPLLGVASVVLLDIVLIVLGTLFGSRASFRNGFAMLSYASVPIILTLIAVLPVKLAVFGKDFFGTNPHPVVIHPVPYVTLVGLDLLSIAWTTFLLVTGTGVLFGFSRGKSVLVGLLVAGVGGGVIVTAAMM